jgi:hypothetical protein
VAACRGRSQRGLAIAQKRIAPILAVLADGEQQLNQARAAYGAGPWSLDALWRRRKQLK